MHALIHTDPFTRRIYWPKSEIDWIHIVLHSLIHFFFLMVFFLFNLFFSFLSSFINLIIFLNRLTDHTHHHLFSKERNRSNLWRKKKWTENRILWSVCCDFFFIPSNHLIIGSFAHTKRWDPPFFLFFYYEQQQKKNWQNVVVTERLNL